MEFSKDYINDSENINYRNNFFVNVTKELSLIVWVLIVLMLIIWSYVENEYSLSKKSEIDLYEMSISEEIQQYSKIDRK